VSEFTGPVCAFLSSVTWAIGSASYSKLARTNPAFAVNFTRALVALPMFVVASYVTLGWDPFSSVGWRHVGWFSLSMFASYGLGDVLFYWSTRSLGVPGALAIASAYPLWTALGSAVFGAQTLAGPQWAGLVLTIGGVITVILCAPQAQRGLADPRELSRKSVGVMLALGTSGLWALNSFAVSRGGADLAAPVGNTLRMLLALGISFALGRLMAPGSRYILPRPVIRASLGVFAIEAFGGSYFYVVGLSQSPLVIGSTLSSLAPVLAVPVAWALKLERVSIPRTLGICLVVAGLWLLVVP
jgi:drug/metabolite transporter (DMT)-like permease